jgi:2-polyprenyl-3-methyl-5-hydroxy-6-metoxy-1,4-benzoquinol methylase
MAQMTSENVARFFDSYAEGFNAIYGNRDTFVNRLVNKHLRSSMRIRFEKSIAGCHPIKGRSVVDVGTGPGHYAITLAEKGAGRVLGVDFAEGMIDVARKNAAHLGADSVCEFQFGDFHTYDLKGEKFNYGIAMGFMDYMANPQATVNRLLSLVTDKAFFSFPSSRGVLAWQRKLRYKSKCDLYLFSERDVRRLFDESAIARYEIEKISRDFFVTAYLQ